MKPIERYLNYIYKEFEKDIRKADTLCELEYLNYDSQRIPDYNNLLVQQLYLLRYAFAYSYEYMDVYKQILARIGNQKEISVVSIGCGTMIDYWSFVEVLSAYNLKGINVSYTGIDEVEWSYRFLKRQKDQMSLYLHYNAIDYFLQKAKFDSDVYFFPKSISEFSMEEIRTIASCFEKKVIVKNRFFMCVSLRTSERNRTFDMEKTKILLMAIERNGFYTNQEYLSYFYYPGNQGIAAYDSNYHYPDNILSHIYTLNEACKGFGCDDNHCGYKCSIKLNRMPILSTKQICYQIISFERRVAA